MFDYVCKGKAFSNIPQYHNCGISKKSLLTTAIKALIIAEMWIKSITFAV